jgi:hypothetical protein
LRGERGFREVDQVLRCHPGLVRTALWLGGRWSGACSAQDRLRRGCAASP